VLVLAVWLAVWFAFPFFLVCPAATLDPAVSLSGSSSQPVRLSPIPVRALYSVAPINAVAVAPFLQAGCQECKLESNLKRAS